MIPRLSSLVLAALLTAVPYQGKSTPLENVHGTISVQGFAFSPDGRFVAAGTAAIELSGPSKGREPPPAIVLWSTQTGEIVHRLEGLGWDVGRVLWIGKGRQLLGVGLDDQTIGIWDLEKAAAIRSFRLGHRLAHHFMGDSRIQIAPGGRHFVAMVSRTLGPQDFAITGTGELEAWDLQTGKLAWSYAPKAGRIHAFDVSKDGRSVILAVTGPITAEENAGGEAIPENFPAFVQKRLSTGKTEGQWTYPGYDPPYAIAWGRKPKQVLAVTDRGLVFWDLAEGKKEKTLSFGGSQNLVYSYTFTKDRRHVARALSSGGYMTARGLRVKRAFVDRIGIETGKVSRVDLGPRPMGVTVSPDLSMAVSARMLDSRPVLHTLRWPK